MGYEGIRDDVIQGDNGPSRDEREETALLGIPLSQRRSGARTRTKVLVS